MTLLNPEDKERLLEEFRDFLEQCGDEAQESATTERDTAPGETTLGEITPSEAAKSANCEPPPDLRTLLAEMAALKNEIRLESRQFKSALDEVRGFGEALHGHNERMTQDIERLRQQAAQIQRQTERKLLLDLLDVHDRLRAGAEAAAAPRGFEFSRLLAPGATRMAQSLMAGTQLSLRRLDELLSRHGVRPLKTLGQALDPQTMSVVATEEARDAPEGSVLREARRGFTHAGELLRAAEVIVNKKAATS